MHFNLVETITTFGYFGLVAIVFAESGLFFGFFLPGDSLLVTAGLLASQGIFDIIILLVLLPVAAISGDSIGYLFGNKVGPAIFKRESSLLFDKKHLERAHAFYEKHGGKTIILARFMPIIRTFAPIVAGVGKMEYKRFLFFNIFGGLFWAWAMLLIGFFLGHTIPDVDKYLLPVIALVIFISILPAVIENIRHNRGKIFAKFMDLVSKIPFKG
jgi:membrane-associated protein